MSAFQAIAKVEAIQSKHTGLATFGRALLAGYSQSQYRELFHLCEDLAKSLGRSVGVPAQHPYAGVRLTSLLPGQENEIQLVLEKAKLARDLAEESAQSLALALEMPTPDDVGNANKLETLAEYLNTSPNLEGMPGIGSHWDSASIPPLEQLLDTGLAHKSLKSNGIPGSGRNPGEPTCPRRREDVALFEEKWWRILSGKYRKAANAIKACSRSPLPKGPSELNGLCGCLGRGNTAPRETGCRESIGTSIFRVAMEIGGIRLGTSPNHRRLGEAVPHRGR